MIRRSQCAMYAILLLALISCRSEQVSAGDYYVAPSGDDNAAGTKAAPFETIDQCNAQLRPGDTCHVLAGEYEERIEPARSGTDGNYITYSGAADAVITKPPGRVAIKLEDKSYIRVTGFTVDGKGSYKDANLDSFVNILGGAWNVIENNDFKNARGWYAVFLQDTQHNSLIDNRIDNVGAWVADKPSGPREGVGDMIGLLCANHNLIAGNHLTRGGHNLLHVSGSYNVIRDNLFDNQWGEGIGYRAAELSSNQRFCERDSGYNLFEHNIVRNSLTSPSKDRTVGIKVEGTGQIVRYNIFDGVDGPAMSSAIRPPIIPKSEKARIYNNTVKDTESLWWLGYYGDGRAFDNRLVNNYMQDVKKTALYSLGDTGTEEGNFLAANLDGELDERYRPDRAAIDAGQFLTRVKSAGSGKAVSVEDAGWFSAGFDMVDGDLVRIGDNEPVRVTEVDYEQNTLTLTDAITWRAGDNVSLPYAGEAPDVGAVEVDESASE